MNEWTSYLETLGGQWDNAGTWRFPGTDESSGNRLVAISHFALLECDGADAAKFLQGQMTASAEHANGIFAPLTAFCTPKGRVIANAELLRVEENRYWLLLDESLAEPLLTQLNKYAPFYRMSLTRRDDLCVAGLVASASDAPPLPEAVWHMQIDNAVVALRHPGDTPRWLLIASPDALENWWQTNLPEAQPVDASFWRRLDIDAGLAWLGAAQSDSLLPQMINWEALGGISFRKGCYTGQEVVARAHFRGQVKRRLAIGRLESTSIPILKSEVRTAEGKRVGELLAAVPISQAEIAVLVVVNSGLEETELRIDEGLLALSSLPYPLERLDPETIAVGEPMAQAGRP